MTPIDQLKKSLQKILDSQHIFFRIFVREFEKIKEVYPDEFKNLQMEKLNEKNDNG